MIGTCVTVWPVFVVVTPTIGPITKSHKLVRKTDSM